MTYPPPKLEHLCDLAVDVGTPIDAGVTPFGRRRLVPITGGAVTGRLAGRVLPGGADVQIVGAETTARLEAQYMLELHDGSVVYVKNLALRVASAEVTGRMLRGEPVDAAAVYFRGQLTLESGDPRWAWLGERQFLSIGQRRPDAVLMSFYLVR